MRSAHRTFGIFAPKTFLYVAIALIAGCSSNPRFSDSHPAAVSDPPTDPNHPARGAAFTIVSSGSRMNAQFFLAAGAAKRPTMLLLHGTPGNERNLDLAQAARRAGWNVLTFHYRGSWGSEGDYTLTNAIQDTNAAMNFLMDQKNIERYQIDTNRLVVVGHSTGGFNAAIYGANNTKIAGVALIDAWNAAPAERPYSESARSEFIARTAQGPTSLVIRSAEAYVDDYITQKPLTDWAKSLSTLPVLLVAAEKANGPANKVLAAAIRQSDGTHLQVEMLQTDHAFSDRRIELTNILLKWLDKIAGQADQKRVKLL